jgi:hypothetical protein
LNTQRKRTLTVRCTGMCVLLAAVSISSMPDFLGCMNEAARQAEINQNTAGTDSAADDNTTPPQLSDPNSGADSAADSPSVPDGTATQDSTSTPDSPAVADGGSPPADSSTPSDQSDQPNQTAPETPTWTNGGFDIDVSGAVCAAKWDPYTKDRYVVVDPGANPTVTVTRRSDMRDADGQLRAAGNTRVHIGPLTIGNDQIWTPDADAFSADGGFVYSAPFETGPITDPTPVQIWNQHAGILFNGSAWLAYGSNALEIWFIPSDMTPGDIMPPDYSNGRIPAGTLVTAPEGLWPPLYRDAADEARLHAAVAKFHNQGVQGGSGPFDIRGDGDYYNSLSEWAAQNALLGWDLNSAPHLNAACEQLLALLSVRFFGHEVAAWYRPRCVPSADLLTTYGREQQTVFFNAMIAACALGPNMANALTPQELDAVNAHLYRYAVHDVYASLTEDQYYTADGGINLHYLPISVTAGWNWDLPDLVNVGDTLSNPTHTACSYFISGGVGRYALRYCQKHDASDTSYEDVGNSQSVRFWYRFGEFFGQPTNLDAVDAYVQDQFGGDSYSSIQDALGALMDNWTP